MTTLAALDNEAAVLLSELKNMIDRLNQGERSERWTQVRSTLETEYRTTSRYRETLPKSYQAMAAIADIRDIDERFADAKVDPGYTGAVLWLKLRKDESYADFKLIVGKLVKRGWIIGSGKTDENYGSVDWNLYKDGAYLTLYVSPGDSETCRIIETEESRPVKLKKIVCNGKVVGEMATAQLVDAAVPDGGDHVVAPAPTAA